MIIGYNIFTGEIKEKNRQVYCIVKTHDIKSIVESEVSGVKVGSPNKMGNIYWIVEEQK